MRSQPGWTLSLGRWGNVAVRLHMFFVLFALCSLFLAWREASHGRDRDLLATTALGLLVLFASVLTHELGHWYLARRLGADLRELVLWPLGGLSPIRIRFEPHVECLIYLAGPLTNLAVCLLVSSLLLATGHSLQGLFHPLTPTGLYETASWLLAAKLAVWINGGLFVINMLPAFPFDAGRAVRSGLSALWLDSSPLRAAWTAALIAKLAAFVLMVLGLIDICRQSPSPAEIVPAWFSLLLLATFVYFSAKQEECRVEEEDDEWEFGGGLLDVAEAPGPAAHPPSPPGPLARWLARRRHARQQALRRQEVEDEQRADEILGRLHECGLDQLSSEERAILKRVSDRLRSRQVPRE